MIRGWFKSWKCASCQTVQTSYLTATKSDDKSINFTYMYKITISLFFIAPRFFVCLLNSTCPHVDLICDWSVSQIVEIDKLLLNHKCLHVSQLPNIYTQTLLVAICGCCIPPWPPLHTQVDMLQELGMGLAGLDTVWQTTGTLQS